LSDLVDNLDAVIWEADPGTLRFRRVSRAAERLLGYPIALWLEEHDFWRGHIHPADRDAVVTTRLAAIRNGEDHELQYRMIAASGLVRWVREIVRVTIDDRGQVTQLRGILVVLTEGRREDATREAREEKLRVWLDSTAEGTFSGQRAIKPKLVTLEEVVVSAEGSLRRLIGEDIELLIISGGEPTIVRIDPGQLEQIITKLARTARDAMPQGGTLTIETGTTRFEESYALTQGAGKARFAMLSVGDTAVGMDAQTQARIFETLFTTKVLGKGTGLGPATVYGIVKQSGGFIWVSSEPGLGTTFKIYFPIA